MKQIFESARISFVEVSEQLIGDYLVMVNDSENVQRFIGKPHEPFTGDQERDWVRSKLEEKAQVFSMIEKAGGQFIGNIELVDICGAAAELGIAITAAKQNLGYGTEAVAAMARYGMDRLGLRRVWLRTKPDNARAIHVYENCGFREYLRTEDHVHMELTR